MTLEHFLSMGGYAFYVWTAYGIALAVLALNIIAPLRRKAEVREDIARALRQEAARQQRAKP